jgi:uncharacterized protein (TIGR00645 family)
MFRNIERLIATTLTASRWLMAPLYLGLIAALGIILVEFFRELAHIVTGFGEMTPEMVKLAVLKLVDIVLVGNLVVIMTAAGVQALASSAVAAADRADEWMGKLDFNGLKFKILASIVAITAIELLETFMNIASTDKTDVLWKILILLALVLAGALLAWTDRLASDPS